MRLTLKKLIIVALLYYVAPAFATTGEEFAELVSGAFGVDSLIEKGQFEPALKKARELCKRHEKSKESAVINVVGALLANEADILINLERYGDAEKTIKRIQDEFFYPKSPLPHYMVKSYYLLGSIGEKTNEHKKSFDAYENLIKLYAENSAVPNADWMLAHALVRAGYTYEMTGHIDRAHLYYEETTKRFGQPKKLEGFLALEEAYYRLTFLDFMENPGEVSLESQNRYLEHFDVPLQIDFDKHIAVVLYGKSLSLQMLNRKKELKSVLQTWLKRFGNRKERPYTDHQEDVKKTLAKLR
jgi:tetratricopeptide (TPR) repeat protein